MVRKEQISENSKRLARNTVVLYFRLLLMMLVGLYTSRVVLDALGVEDYGTYNAVGGIVSLFAFVTNSIISAIGRYLAVGIGEGDQARLRRIFATSQIIQLCLSAVLVILVEVAAHFLLEGGMKIPLDRMPAAKFVLQCSIAALVVNMLAVPFNAAIIAHEKMTAYAAISVGESLLKLGAVILLQFSHSDRLKLYSAFIFLIAVIVRLASGLYCRMNFEECKGKLEFNRRLFKEMTGFAGWSLIGSSAFVANTQGVNIVVNMFFGVLLNAARGVAGQVEGLVKHFASSFLTALNPQITKSWSSGDKDYCFDLVSKGSKFSYLVILVFFTPILFEADYLLELWLVDVPAHSASFLRLTLAGLMVDMFGNPLLTLSLATGKIKGYYLITGLTSWLCLPLVYLLFKLGLPPEASYVVFILTYLIVVVEKLLIVKRTAGFPILRYLKTSALPMVVVTAASFLPAVLLRLFAPEGFIRAASSAVLSGCMLLLAAWKYSLTEGEKEFFFRKVARFLPDWLFLKINFELKMGRPLKLADPKGFNDKIQWLKLHDRNPLYTVMVDKVKVKEYVSGIIGEEYVIPTLGVWENADDVDFDSLPEQFVIKCNHNSGHGIYICKDKGEMDADKVREGLRNGLKENYYLKNREWPYKNVPRRIIAEKLLPDSGPEGLVDYKLMVFGGKVRCSFTCTDRFSDGGLKMNFYDRDWNRMPFRRKYPNADHDIEKPENYEKMVELAEKLAQGLAFARIDFYESDGRLYFGEITLYPGSGIEEFSPEEWDYKLGELIRLPRRRRI